jgi:Domain of unknown function (DUF4328)
MEPDPPNPYAAPETRDLPPETGTPVLDPGPYGPYRDNRVLARWLTGLLLFGLLAHAARIAVNLVYAFSSWFADPDASSRIEAAFQSLWFIALSCMILFGVWIVRSGKNAWLFAGLNRATWRAGSLSSPKFLEDTPGWAVGWYFIPIASLWKPYVAMRDIVRASTLESGLPGWLLPFWWTLWILSQFTGHGSVRIGTGWADWVSAEDFVYWLSGAGIEIALHTVAILLVLGVTRLQSDTAADYAGRATAGDPELTEPGPPGPA